MKGILKLFHHYHKSKGKTIIHHCGGDHITIDPKLDYTIAHCSCGKHRIDKQTAIGHGKDREKLVVQFSGECPEGGWHVESGTIVKR